VAERTWRRILAETAVGVGGTDKMKYIVNLLAVLVAAGLIGCSSQPGNSGGPGETVVSTTEQTQETQEVKETQETQVSNVQKDDYFQISMDEAVTMMEEETDYIILDVRRPDEFAEKHIPNAINVPNESIGEEEISELPDKDQLILVYCRSGNRSKQASKKLAALGYTNVYEFGGINEWTGETVKE